MKTNPLLAALAAVLFVCCLGTILLSARHFFAIVELERVQAAAVEARNTANIAQALANDAIRYGENNPTIRPVLDQFRTKVEPPPAAEMTPEAPVPLLNAPNP